MKRTITTPSAAKLGALSIVAGLSLLVACSYAPGITPAPAPPTSSPQTVLPPINGEDDGSVDITPDYTPTALLAEPTEMGTPPVTARADVSPLPSPTLLEQQMSHIVADVASGGPAPDFTLESAHGELVTLSDYQGESNVVLVFYRGKT